ncbi:MAG: response regulator [bacterium]
MKKVLIVDDEKMFLKTLCEGLNIHGKTYGFEILTANNGRQAIDILNSTEIDLVITDLRMPEIDGFKLIAYISSKFKDLPVMVMTAYGSHNIEMEIRDKGILHYVEKPIDFDDLLKKILSELKAERRGRVKGMNLATFLQIIGMEKISYTLTVTRGKDIGHLYIKDGELIHAGTKNKKGLEAAMDIVTWDGVTIDLIDNCTFKGNTINMALENILLQAFKDKDEKSQINQNQIDKTRNIQEEVEMNVPKLNEAIEVIKSNLGPGLLSTDIFTLSDAQSIAGWNSNPTACALFTQIITMMNTTLKESGFPELGKYLLLDLVDGKMVLTIPMDEYIWLVLLDGKKSPLGLLLNVVLPKAIEAFEEALIG